MKKTFALILAALLVVSSLLSLSGCKDGEKTGKDTPVSEPASADTAKTSSEQTGGKKVKIGVQSGTTGQCFMAGDEEWGFEGFANCAVSPYDTGALAVQDMKAGNIDYVVIDAEPAKQFAATIKGVKVIDIALTSEAYAVAVDKGQPELLADINKALSEKKADIDAIFAKYADVDDSNSAHWKGDIVPAGKYDASKDQLVVATNAAFAPYEFVVGDGFAGIDMEIAQLLAGALNMELVILDMDFDAITGSLGKNGVDIGLAGMTISPAREKVVAFSDPYFTEAYQVVVCNVDDATFDGCKTTEEMVAKLKSLNA